MLMIKMVSSYAHKEAATYKLTNKWYEQSIILLIHFP